MFDYSSYLLDLEMVISYLHMQLINQKVKFTTHPFGFLNGNKCQKMPRNALWQ